MSIGICGQIHLFNHTVNDMVDLSYSIIQEATSNRLGCKLGGNISEDVWDFYSGRRSKNKNSIYFEITDSPLDNYAQELFAPDIDTEIMDYEEAFDKIMRNNLGKIKNVLTKIYESEFVVEIDIDIDYQFREDENIFQISLNEFVEYVLKKYYENDYWVPALGIQIVKS